MAEISQGSIIAITARYTHDGQENLNTFHFKWTSIGAVPFPTGEVFGATKEYWEAVDGPALAFLDCLSVDVTDVEWYFQVIGLIRMPKRLMIGAASGTVAGPALPPNVANVISFRGDFSGRRYIATKHIGGVPTSFSSGGMVTATALEKYADFAALLDNELSLNDPEDQFLAPIVLHRDNMSASPFITNYILGTTTRTMRRRTVGLGT